MPGTVTILPLLLSTLRPSYHNWYVHFSRIIASLAGSYGVTRGYAIVKERREKTFGVIIPESFNTVGGIRIGNGRHDHASIDLAIHSFSGIPRMTSHALHASRKRCWRKFFCFVLLRVLTVFPWERYDAVKSMPCWQAHK